MWGRLVPFAALLLLETPLNYVGLICHEGGHGVVALAQGGTFTGILITQTGSYALASSSLVWIGGWAGQYVLAVAALLLYWKARPRSFLGRSVLVVLAVQNLLNEPPYIASLQNDSEGALRSLETLGIGASASAILLVAIALALGAIGGYAAWKVVKNYLSSIFDWMTTRRAKWAALFFIVGSGAEVWVGYFVPSIASVTTSPLVLIPALIAFFLLLSLVVVPPPPPEFVQSRRQGPSIPTLTFIMILFIEAQIVFFLSLPLTIPFP